MKPRKPKRGRPFTGIVTKPVMVRIPTTLLREFKKYQQAIEAPSLQAAIRQAMSNATASLSA